MIRLLLADLRHNLRQWVWTAVVTLVAAGSAAAQLMVGRGATAAAHRLDDPDMAASAVAVTAWVLSMLVLAVIAVLTTVASLAVASRARDHGLWRTQGMSPRTLRALLLGQLALLGAATALAGAVLGAPLSRALVPLLREMGAIVPTATPQAHPADLGVLMALCVGATVLGGRSAASRSTRTRVVDLLQERDSDRHGRRRRVLGALVRGGIVAGCLTGFVVAVVSGHGAGPGSETSVGAVNGAAFGALGMVVALVPWVVPGLERAWTALVPVRSVAWYMARRSAAYEAGRSSASVLPFALSVGLVGMFYTYRALGAEGVSVQSLAVMFGLALLVAWTGGVAVIAMGAGRRRRDGALLLVAGGTPQDVRAAQALEGVIHAVTAVLLGTCSTAATVVAGAAVMDIGVGRTFLDGPWVEIGVVGAATLVTTCAAVVLSGAAVGAPVAGVLRARD